MKAMIPTRPMRSTTAAALVSVVALLAAACGQKPGVHVERALPNIIVEQTTGAGGPTVPGTPGTPGDPGSGGAAPGAPGAPAGTPAPGGGSDVQLTMQGSDRTGVTDDTLTLGLHAPVTGAAPLPAVSFREARDLYWRWLTEIEGQQVLGRSRVEVGFQDDRYTPSTAVQTCRELAASSFMVVGGGGADGIQACGQFADQANVPYLSNGVSEAGLSGRDWYFALAMSYPAQASLLTQFVKQNFGDAKTAAIITDTSGFDDSVAAWDDGVGRNGLNHFRTLRHAQGTSAWITSYVRDLQQEGVEVIFMLMAPTFYIQFAQQAASQNYRPQFVGVGATMGLNAVLGSGCPHVDRGIFFSPWPGLDWARQNVPQFFDAGARLGVPVDDIALALWSLARAQHEMLNRYQQVFGSTDLTREDFRNMLERQEGIQTGIGPQLSFSPSDHFGAGQVHVLQADCASEEYKTLHTFASGF